MGINRVGMRRAYQPSGPWVPIDDRKSISPGSRRMGMRLFSSSTEPIYKEKHIQAGDPDPFKFDILVCAEVNGLYVTMIRYPNCTNYEGIKVLVTTYDTKTKTKLDPHFFEGSGLIARFEPTYKGLEAAKKFAEAVGFK